MLASFIPGENVKAHKYLNNLAALYRYLLKSREKDVVGLQDELEQAEKYAYLIKERFGNAYQFRFHYPKEHHSALMLPPLVIQELLVNAIKHNEAGTDFPLEISVTVSGNEVEVKNNVMKRNNLTETAKTGIGHLNARYRLLTDRPVECIETAESFLVRLPLLKLITGK